MIFLSVGSERPFSRLVRAVDAWSGKHPEQEVIAQIGKISDHDHVPVSFEFHSILDQKEYIRLSEQADLLIAHAGMGTIISAVTLGKPLVIMPRLARNKEATSDHQYATAKKFVAKEGIFIAWDQAEFDATLDEAIQYARQHQVETGDRFAPPELIERIRGFINLQ